MKKILIVLLGIISLVSDIFGIMSGFKEFFTGKGISPEVASNLNTFLVCFFTIILVIMGIVMGIQYYLRRFGTRKIPCTLYAYYYYRIANKHHSLLGVLHREMYHKSIELKSAISRMKHQRMQESNPNPLTIDDIKPNIISLLQGFHTTLDEVFHLDVSISVFLLLETEDKKQILTKPLFLKSHKELKKKTERIGRQKYLITNIPENSDFVNQAIEYNEKHGKGSYVKNSAFDYVLSSSSHSWMSNDLTIDKNRNAFYSSSPNCNKFYKSLAAFAIKPPLCDGVEDSAIKGIVVFDSPKTGVFSENECSLIMGLMAHILYDVLDNLKVN